MANRKIILKGKMGIKKLYKNTEIFRLFLFMFFVFITHLVFPQFQKTYVMGDSAFIWPFYEYTKPPVVFLDSIIVDKQIYNGRWVQFYDDSVTIHVLSTRKNGLLIGEAYEFYKNGNPERIENYDDEGNLVERTTFWWNNGNKETFEKFEGNKSILLKSYHENGVHEYLDSADIQMYWFKNGNKRAIVHSQDFKKHGEVKFWYQDGRLAYSGNWEMGIQVGTAEFYNRKGKMKYLMYEKLPKYMKKILYSADRVLVNEEWYPKFLVK